jgi:hypothetical protein
VGNGAKLFSQKYQTPHSLVESVLLRRFSKLITAEQKLSIQRDVHFGGPKMDEKGLAVRKWPEAPARFTEIYQTRPPFVGLGHDKFRSSRELRPPGGHFLKAGGRRSNDF